MGGMVASARLPESTSPLSVRNPLVQLSIAGLLGTVAIGVGSFVASQRAGAGEAMNDVRTHTEVIARTVLESNLSPELIAGDQATIDRFDKVVRREVLDGSTLRVKLWDADGRIVYSDERRLIGEVYSLEGDKEESLRSGEIVSEISSLQGPENRFETDLNELLEVYLPIDGPDGEPLLYESYYSMTAVQDATSRIRRQFAPVVVAPLLVTQSMNFLLAWQLNRRLRRARDDRERLLRRVIESSDLERRRIARDLHDGVVQDLAGTLFTIAAAAETASHVSPELAADLRSASVGARRSLQSLRSLLVDIYPANLKSQGLEAALVDLLAPANTLGIRTDLTIAGAVDRSVETSALVYRVVQEAVRNVIRHASAETMHVGITAGDRSTVAVVTDDGRGFDPKQAGPEGHLGLRLLTDLADDTGANLDISSQPGRGTSVRLEVFA